MQLGANFCLNFAKKRNSCNGFHYEFVCPQKNPERFRKDVIILAGYFDATYRLDGDVRIEAKSISFASMSEDEFEKLYSATIDVILKHVCTQFDGKMLDEVVEQALAFA